MPAALLQARPLSEPMSALLRNGDAQGAYSSRSQAVMATAVACVGAGWSYEQWHTALHAGTHDLATWSTHKRLKHGGTKPRQPADVDRRLSTTWRRAAARVRLRPAAADAPSVRAELSAIRGLVDTHPEQWSGASGVTDHAVLQVALTTAYACCRLTISISTRQIADAANISYSTASVALRRLTDAGWLRLETPAGGVNAATYRLLAPALDTPASAADLEQVLEQLPPRAVSFTDSARSHDAFAHTINRGMGRVAARVFDQLDDGAHGGRTPAQIAVLTGLHPQTVRRHLVTLQAAGLVTTGRRGATWARSLAAGDPDTLLQALVDAAAVLGCAGVTALRRERHQAQREAYTTWWTDFDARRGWAVQRGLYRADRPRLALHAAAA